MDADIRWRQRFEKYKTALSHLEEAITEYANTDVDIIKEGIVQRFELTHELAWKVMQDMLKSQGETNVFGSKSATRIAFNYGLITEGEVWLDMIESRNITVHTYDAEILHTQFNKIVQDYLPRFLQFSQRVEELWQTLD